MSVGVGVGVCEVALRSEWVCTRTSVGWHANVYAWGGSKCVLL